MVDCSAYAGVVAVASSVAAAMDMAVALMMGFVKTLPSFLVFVERFAPMRDA